MGRAPRSDEAGVIYHALNRGNARNPIFFKDGGDEAFERSKVDGIRISGCPITGTWWFHQESTERCRSFFNG